MRRGVTYEDDFSRAGAGEKRLRLREDGGRRLCVLSEEAAVYIDRRRDAGEQCRGRLVHHDFDISQIGQAGQASSAGACGQHEESTYSWVGSVPSCATTTAFWLGQ